MRTLDVLRVLCIPLIPVYAFVVAIRNYLFNRGMLKTKAVNSFVISIGNLTTGGSGKSPFTIKVTNMLKSMGLRAAVLSRGYGRDSEGYLLVSDGKQVYAKVEDAGDEMLQTVLNCDVPAAVCEDRIIGAEELLDDFAPDALVLDDAYQHRYIERNVNIVLFDQRFFTRRNGLRRLMLPTGDLREPVSEVKRADCVIINRKFSAKAVISDRYMKLLSTKPVFQAHYKTVGFLDVRNNEFFPAEEFQGQKSLLVCGIANPHSFITAMESFNISTDEQLIFADHKLYTNEEVQQIRKVFYDKNCYSVITTEKDSVKLAQFSKELDDIDIYYLKIEMQLEEEDAFKNYLDGKWQEYKRKKLT